MFIRSLLIPCLAMLVGAAVSVAPVLAQEAAAPIDAAAKEAIETIVRDYILSHPEIVQQALQIADAKRVVAEERALQQAILVRREELVNDPDSPVVGNAEGDVTIVEFMDYRCGFCRRASPVVAEVLAADPKLRLVLKEFPILGPDSVAAARIALAAHRQDATIYDDLHQAIFASEGPIDEGGVLAIAGSLGLDVERLKAEMNDPAIDAILGRNEQLAQRLNIRGTPTFVIGAKILPGFSTAEAIRDAVTQERVRLASLGAE